MRVAARLADGFDIGKRGPGGAFLTEDEMRAINAELDAACRAMKRERRLMRSHWSGAEITDDASLRTLRDRIEAYARAGLDRYILAFPKERAAEMIPRASAVVRH
jgi:hypothetical protein